MNQTVAMDRASRVLMLAPHPDDESLAAGGLLQQAQKAGSAVRVLFATDGDNNPWAQRAVEHIWRIGPHDRARWAQRRRRECLNALACLGIGANQAVYLGYPDQELTAMVLGQPRACVDSLLQQCSTWRPTMVVAPSINDLHPDHSAWGVVARLAWRQLQGSRISFTLICYIVHGRPLSAADERYIQLALSEEERARKRSAILCHRTQLRFGRGRLLQHARAAEVYELANQNRCASPHLNHRVAIDGGALILERHGSLTRRSSRVHVLAASAVNDIKAFSATITNRTTADVRQAPFGPIVTRAGVFHHGRSLSVSIPEMILGVPSLVLTKWVSKGLFFDESGWQCHSTAPLASSQESSRNVAVAQIRNHRVCAVIPCFNVEAYCDTVVREAASMVDHLIVVDDGSTDTTGEVLCRIACEHPRRLHLLSFPVNRGKGMVLLDAFRYALARVPFDVLVTLDGDGQHAPFAIAQVVRPCIEDACDLVVGERLELAKMPLRSRIGNALIRSLVRSMHRSAPIDTQSGFRAHSRALVQEAVRCVRGQRYETELHVLLLALQQRRRIGTVTVPTIYCDGNRSSHFRPIIDSMRVAVAFILGSLIRPALPNAE